MSPDTVGGGLLGSPPAIVTATAEPLAHGAAQAAPALDPWQLMIDAGPVVKAVLIVLLGASVVCWAIIVAKTGMLWALRARSRLFLRVYERDAAEAANRLGTGEGFGPHGRLYLAALQEESARPGAEPPERDAGADAEGVTRRVERALERAVDREITRMEGWLGVLATIGSTAPFVGLFGTVWGIMTSFLAIGAKESATLAVVAPGIAEALIATAVGLFAAVPAVIGYNALVRRVRIWNEELAAFASHLVNEADARIGAGASPPPAARLRAGPIARGA